MDGATGTRTSAPVLSIGLYPRLLGGAWDELCEPVRRVHAGGRGLRARGSFEVRRGPRRLARWMCALLRLPAEGSDQAVQLAVLPHRAGERWERIIGEASLITEQTEHPPGHLAERFGAIELAFRLEVHEHSLVFAQVGAALRLGALRMPLPRLLSPRVAARATANPHGPGASVWVELRAPFVGELTTYEGIIAAEEPPR